jgi:hypothetical protein
VFSVLLPFTYCVGGGMNGRRHEPAPILSAGPKPMQREATHKFRVLYISVLTYEPGIQMMLSYMEEMGWLSRYSDWLRAGRPRGRSSSPGGVKNFLFSTSPHRFSGPTQSSSYPVGTEGSFRGGKLAWALS